MALGVGGIPKGRIIEIFGPESSGKTTLALHIVAEVQKKGGIAAFIDAIDNAIGLFTWTPADGPGSVVDGAGDGRWGSRDH